MEGEVLIKAENVGKKFCRDLKKSLWYGAKDLARATFGKESSQELRPDEFWAVQNISFEVKRGQCLGLIGHNGAGKSTLLKLLNGLIRPDTGRIEMRGRVGALIELGAGFNPILTGRENIFNNAAVLGFSKKETQAKLDEIIAFSEIEEFIDMPVQNYSSGMRVRLGFSVAAQMEPDILLIDEVLAVGDLGFVLKCFKQIDTILPHTAVIFVSHSMPKVSRICNELILMDKGVSKYQGPDVPKGIDLYYNKFVDNNSRAVFSDNSLKLIEAKIETSSAAENDLPVIQWKEPLSISLVFENTNCKYYPRISCSVYDKELRSVALLSDRSNKEKHLNPEEISPGRFKVTLLHENCQLSKGVYSINISASDPISKSPVIRINNVLAFQVISEEQCWQSFLLDTRIEYNQL